MKSRSRVCPWCDTELVFDEEFGPDETCPHCGNELGDYRTVRVHLEKPDEPPEASGDVSGGMSAGLDPRAGTGWAGLEPVIRRMLDEQDELPECAQCGEYMLLAGTQTVTSPFEPVTFRSVRVALLETPFRLRLYICPSCFRAEYQLSDEDRLKAAERLRTILLLP